MLNLMGVRHIYKLTFYEISEIRRRYIQGQDRTGKGPQDHLSRNFKTSSSGVTMTELGNLLENFKTHILSTLSLQIDTLNLKKKKETENATLAKLCPTRKKKHLRGELSLNIIVVCAICTDKHPTNSCPSLLGVKSMYEGNEGTT